MKKQGTFAKILYLFGEIVNKTLIKVYALFFHYMNYDLLTVQLLYPPGIFYFMHPQNCSN